MMNQETYVKIKDLHAQGWTINEIAEETGWHRTTVSARLKSDPPPEQRLGEAVVMTETWRIKVAGIVEKWPRMQAVSIHRRLVADGFEGSYPGPTRLRWVGLGVS